MTAPAYWTDREPGEPVLNWVLRMQLLYRITRLQSRDNDNERQEVSSHGEQAAAVR